MGVSPLFLSEQEVKNPKNTLIAVTLPGEAPPVMVSAPSHEMEATQEASNDFEDAAAAATAATPFQLDPPAPEFSLKPLLKRKSNIMPAVSEADRLPVVSSRIQPAPRYEPEPTVDEGDNDGDTGNDGPVIRRRRRRSSAAG
jgi:ribonuclease E